MASPSASDKAGNNNDPEQVVDAKHPSDVIGHWGPIQLRVFLTLSIMCIIAPFSNSGTYLYTPKLNFTCDFLDHHGSLIRLNNTCSYRNEMTNKIEKCTNFTYDHSFYDRTLTEEFGMICDHSWYSSFSLSIHQLGYGISGVLLGYISDKKGRLFAARSAISLEILAGFGQAFAPTMYTFWISRLLIGIAAYGRFLTGYVLIMEWIGPKYRAVCTMYYEVPFHLGYTILLIYVYSYPDYRVVQVSASLFEIFLLIIFCLYMYESPRWLMTHDQLDSAEKLLHHAAKRSLTPEEVDRRVKSVMHHVRQELLEEKNVKDQNVFDIWREPILLKLSLILYYTWFTHSFIGYASFFNTENLFGSLFMNLAIMEVSDFLVLIAVTSVFNRLPRKKTLIWGMFAEVLALLLLLTASLNKDWIMFMMIPNLIFRASLYLVIQMYYLYTAETFPTTMRQASMGTCSIFARIGSISAPFVRELTTLTHISVTNSVFLTFVAINFILVLFIPDTGKIEIADTIGQKKKEVQTVINYHRDPRPSLTPSAHLQ